MPGFIDGSEFCEEVFVVWQLLRDQVPKILTVVHLDKMTQLMHDNIVG